MGRVYRVRYRLEEEKLEQKYLHFSLKKNEINDILYCLQLFC